ncbi:MAG: hypothetical protein ACRDXB_06730, partial [Actinomycetes bacterium]
QYTVRTTANRTGARLSTMVSGEWTFESGHVGCHVVPSSWDTSTVGVVRCRDNCRCWRSASHHPAGPGFVSLRTSVADRDGNAHKATIIRAYELR